MFSRCLKNAAITTLVVSFLSACGGGKMSEQELAKLESDRNAAAEVVTKTRAAAGANPLAQYRALDSLTLAQLLKPINLSYDLTMGKIENKFPDRSGMAFAGILCFHPTANVAMEGGACRAVTKDGSRDVTNEIVSKVAAVASASAKGGMVLPGLDAGSIDILTHDKSRPALSQIFLFGDSSYDLVYVTVVALKVKDLQAKVRANPSLSIQESGNISAGTKFLGNLGNLMAEASKAGLNLAAEVTKALTSPAVPS
jgi:hypothetical protein